MTPRGITRRDLLILGSAGLALPVTAGALAHDRAHLFGSAVDLLLPPGTDAALRARVMAGLAEMNTRWNAWKPGDVSALNAAFRAGRPARTTPALVALIRGAARLEALSAGHFNAGIGALVGAWGFHSDVLGPGPAPAAPSVARWVAARPSLAQIEIRGLDVKCSNPALQLDFGAYAKGVAIDWAFDLLQRSGVHDALLNLGGNLATMGQVAGRAWRVGVRDPLGEGLVAALGTEGREAVVTSGSYERWREVDGQRATHIIDPARGVPAPELVSVTVLHPSAAFADAAATALLVAGSQRWEQLAGRMGVRQALVIDLHGRMQATHALAVRLQRAA